MSLLLFVTIGLLIHRFAKYIVKIWHATECTLVDVSALKRNVNARISDTRCTQLLYPSNVYEHHVSYNSESFFLVNDKNTTFK